MPKADPQNLECHTLRHAWRVQTATRQDRIVRLVLRCMRCDTRRVDNVNAETGERYVKARYEYPDGYRLARGEERPTFAGYRQRLVSAILDRAAKK